MLGILEECKNFPIKRNVFGKNIKLLAANIKYLRGMYNFWMQMRCISEEQKTLQVWAKYLVEMKNICEQTHIF